MCVCTRVLRTHQFTAAPAGLNLSSGYFPTVPPSMFVHTYCKVDTWLLRRSMYSRLCSVSPTANHPRSLCWPSPTSHRLCRHWHLCVAPTPPFLQCQVPTFLQQEGKGRPLWRILLNPQIAGGGRGDGIPATSPSYPPALIQVSVRVSIKLYHFFCIQSCMLWLRYNPRCFK